MQSNPVKPQDKGLFGQFSRMGLTDKEFDERNISPAVLEGVKRGLQDAPNVAVSTTVSTSQVRDGWSYVRGLDDFGYNYPLRSLVAGPYLGGQGKKKLFTRFVTMTRITTRFPARIPTLLILLPSLLLTPFGR